MGGKTNGPKCETARSFRAHHGIGIYHSKSPPNHSHRLRQNHLHQSVAGVFCLPNFARPYIFMSRIRNPNESILATS
jgi:hypothetical protein